MKSNWNLEAEVERREINWGKLATTGGIYIQTGDHGRTIGNMLCYYTTKRDT